MPDLLLELFCEEIPARMQAQAADDLKKLVTNALVERGVLYEGAQAFVTPRRLALHVAGLPARQPDTREERKGPRVGAPEAAVQGFLKSAGLATLAEATIVSDPKKGDSYVAVIARAGRATPQVLAEILPGIVKTFPWPKSMRWGAASAMPEALRWVRPLQSIVCLFGPETEEPEVVPFEVGGVVSSNITYGHRFMAPAPIKLRRFEDYVASLLKAYVVLDAERRKQIILHDARDLALAQGLELVEDEGLLNEVAGLVEWPVVLLGEFDAAFLDIPPEVVRATIRANQKCFVLKKPGGGLTNKFVLVSNIVASDGGKVIAAGNARVVRARLSDALYFWQTDQKDLPGYADKGKPLDQRLAKLRAMNIVFHEKLGTQGQRVARIVALARKIAPFVMADVGKAARAAELCKADLMTEVVGEFPEVQGLMGRRYAELQGEDADVAAAIEEHYKPQGPGDSVPTRPVSIAVALADKFDVLVGFWTINEKPTGSKDPFALRRAALGVIGIILQNRIRFQLLTDVLVNASIGIDVQLRSILRYQRDTAVVHLVESGVKQEVVSEVVESVESQFMTAPTAVDAQSSFVLVSDLLAFFHDRLKVHLREQGARHDLIDAALAYPAAPQDDLVLIVTLVEALAKFLATDDGKNLLAGYKRAANILKAEEKKDGAGAFDAAHSPLLRITHEEQALAAAVDRARGNCARCIREEDFEGAMRQLAQLRAPVDAFFEKVTVNDENAARRKNRLCLLNELRVVMQSVADFSKVTG